VQLQHLQYSVGAEDTEGEGELDGIPLGAGLTDGTLLSKLDGIPLGAGLTDGIAEIDGIPLGAGLTDGVLVAFTSAAAVDFKRHKMPTHSAVIFNFRIMDDEKRSETMICLVRNKL
jgi:hypothetical protein